MVTDPLAEGGDRWVMIAVLTVRPPEDIDGGP